MHNRCGCRQASSWRLLLPVTIAAKTCASVGELCNSQATTLLEKRCRLACESLGRHDTRTLYHALFCTYWNWISGPFVPKITKTFPNKHNLPGGDRHAPGRNSRTYSKAGHVYRKSMTNMKAFAMQSSGVLML